jgi:ABC-type nickel/cobalt efflux system permease component RcnA
MRTRRLIEVLAVVGGLLGSAAVLRAHPVPKDAHDRTVVVRLAENAGEVVVTVNYRLELDEWTVIIRDMVPYHDQVPLALFRDKRLEYYGEYTRIYAPILAANLLGQVDGAELEFSCVKREHTLKDEKDQALGHLRCDFVFQARCRPHNPEDRSFKFRENNFADQSGKIDVALVADSSVKILSKTEADAALKARSPTLWAPGDEKRLRLVEATFTKGGNAPSTSPDAPPSTESTRPAVGHDESSLLHLFLSTEYGFWMLLLIAAGVGAVHALTPGHGKTLVAAYLVGQSGTVWHALLLGVVTTITHTGIVLILAFGLQWIYPHGMSESDRRNLQSGLGLFMGLAVVCLGFWLLLTRLTGRADHVHLGGAHHHHHGHGHHHHHAPVPPEGVSTWGLIVLGMSGGIVPCWDAIAMLVLAVGMNLLWMAVPLLLAFSAGLAGVLVLLGIMVVKFRRFASSRWGESRWVRALPVVSALLVTALGFWLCYDSLPGTGVQGGAR